MADYFEVMAIEKFIRMSPRKVRLVADLVRGRSVDEAMGILKMTPKEAARAVERAINSAAANATQNFGAVSPAVTPSRAPALEVAVTAVNRGVSPPLAS